mgnify:CR=1 FL=1
MKNGSKLIILVLNLMLLSCMEGDVFYTKQSVKVLSTGYEPMYTTTWQDAIKDVCTGRFEIVENHPKLVIGTVSGHLPMPVVVRFRRGVFLRAIKVPPKLRKPNRKNIFERDEGICQYCSRKVTYGKSTIDHILPKSRGGKDTWMNLVLCCAPCTSKKGSKTPREASMSLLRIPREMH